MVEQIATPESQAAQELLSQLLAPQPIVIGLEGGPCSGKTTLAEEVSRQALALGYPFIALPEAATTHIEQLQLAGKTVPELAEHDRPAYLAFQEDIVRTISANIASARDRLAGTAGVILIDRPDIGAYLTAAEYRQVLDRVGLAESPLHGQVDKLVYLPSVAREEPARYAVLRGTNDARYETTAEAAAAVCAANLRAVRTHPELQVAWGGVFAGKIRRLAATILQPELEGEIKQAVEPAEAQQFVETAAHKGNLLNTMQIQQSYHRLDGREFRLRKSRGDNDTLHYHFTIKTGEGAFRRELQRSLTECEYELLHHSQQLGRTLLKLRHVVLDDADETGQRRLWFADHYLQPDLSEWHFETEVETQTEYDELTAAYIATRHVVHESAKALIFN